ncbi:MAG TPA: hypothetical protein PLM63_03155 [bacterium]|nr:hypothetical protein [bacterium]
MNSKTLILDERKVGFYSFSIIKHFLKAYIETNGLWNKNFRTNVIFSKGVIYVELINIPPIVIKKIYKIFPDYRKYCIYVDR